MKVEDKTKNPKVVHELPDGFEIKNGMLVELSRPSKSQPSFWLIMRVHNDLFAQCVSKTAFGWYSKLYGSLWADDVLRVYEGFSSGHIDAEAIRELVNGAKPKSRVLWERKPDKVKLTLKEIADKFGVKEELIEIV